MEVVILSLIAGCLVFTNLFILLKYRAAKEHIIDFLTPGEEGEPSPFGVLIANKVQASEMTTSFSGMMMGKASALSKAQQGIEADIANESLAQTNPALTALLEFSPSLKKRMSRSPMVAYALQNLNLAGLAGKKDNHGSGKPVKFKL